MCYHGGIFRINKLFARFAVPHKNAADRTLQVSDLQLENSVRFGPWKTPKCDRSQNGRFGVWRHLLLARQVLSRSVHTFLIKPKKQTDSIY